MFTLIDVQHVTAVYPIGASGLHDPLPLPVDDDLLHMVNMCAKWIELGRDGEKNTAKRSSYGLKHQVESWYEQLTGVRPYVKNSAFIVAAVLTGWTLRLPRTVSSSYVNAFFKRDSLHTTGARYLSSGRTL